MLFEGLRAGSSLCSFMDETQASLPASTVSLRGSSAFSLAHALPFLMPVCSLSTALSLPLASESSRISFRPLVLPITSDSPCHSCSSLSACLSISLSSQAPPGWPRAVLQGPLLSPRRGGGGEHGAGGARQEAGDGGEAGRGKARSLSPTLAGTVWRFSGAGLPPLAHSPGPPSHAHHG